jgi:hypothetical protein
MSDRLAQLLAHPLRDRVLLEYQTGPACPSEIARRLGRPLNAISYHTLVLARHGCLELVRTVRRRGAITHYYRALVPQFIDDDEWAALSVVRRRHLALDMLSRASAEAHAAALAGDFDGPHRHLSRSPAELDAQGAAAASRVLRRALDELSEIADASGRRTGTRRPYLVVLLGFFPDAGD